MVRRRMSNYKLSECWGKSNNKIIMCLVSKKTVKKCMYHVNVGTCISNHR